MRNPVADDIPLPEFFETWWEQEIQTILFPIRDLRQSTRTSSQVCPAWDKQSARLNATVS